MILFVIGILFMIFGIFLLARELCHRSQQENNIDSSIFPPPIITGIASVRTGLIPPFIGYEFHETDTNLDYYWNGHNWIQIVGKHFVKHKQLMGPPR